MYKDIDGLITKKLRKENEIERAKHEPSGRLSASQLKKPLLEQVLKIIGVPQKPVDDYVLRLFLRGKQVEKWLLDDVLKIDPKYQQVELHYEDILAFADVANETVGEVKSVKNSAFKWLEKETKPRWGDALQTAVSALAKKLDTFWVAYVAADDLRTKFFEARTADYKADIDKINQEVKSALKSGVLPPFKGREDYHSKPAYFSTYTDYPEWLQLDTETAMSKLKNQYPNSYDKLQELSRKVDHAVKA